MRTMLCVLWCLSLSVVLTLSGTLLTWADDLQFPATEEEISRALGQKPDTGAGALQSGGNDKSLFGKGSTRGLGTIADDEEALANAPKVGALILFDFNCATIKSESLPLLREYGKALEHALKDAVLIVAGHTDSTGTEEYNFTLSERRAQAVRNFLLAEFTIGEQRLLVKPYGEEKPIADNSTDDGRAQNRRVEFIRIQ